MKRTVGHERYFTVPGLAARCVALTDNLLGLHSFDLVVEPSAGAGSFLRLLPEERRIGLDLEPRAAGVAQADFLTWAPPSAPGARVLTIGNPPFGQRAALAFEFFERAATFSCAVAFILPRSFNKYTFQNRVHPSFHLAGAFDCDEFHDESDRPVSVRTVFQVWERREEERPRVVMPDTHPHFTMRHAHLSRLSRTQRAAYRRDHDFTVPQVGADFRPRDVEAVETGSHWFVRPLVPGVRERFERLDFSFLDGMNTAHKSLSKGDILTAYLAAEAEEN